MRKALLSATVVFVAAIGLNSAAGAAPQTSAAPARLSTNAAAANYLRSLGINPAGVVIQRGSKNYAGPNCPGSQWNCTKASRVLQITTRAGAANEFSCTPAAEGTVPPNKCVIVQTSTTGNNTAACRIAGSTTGVQQECTVTQTSVSGTNRLELKEELTLSGATTSGTQVASVVQRNGSGANVVGLTQRSVESITDNRATSVTWSQSASQSFSIDQEADTGTNTVNVSQSVAQTQSAPNATSGSQSQFSDQQAEVDQFSHGVSTLKIKQSENQSQTAKEGGLVDQTQIGPQGCCSSQADNPANTATIKQEATQVQKPGSDTSDQTQSQTVTYSSSGNISGSQTATQDGTTSTNSFSGSTVSEQQACSDGSCTTEPPPPPANWQQFNWQGGVGSVPGESPFSIEASAPVVVSVTDVLCTGDRFTISDGATTLGTTSVPGSSTCDHPGFTGDPAVVFTDPAYSHGTFALAAGSHSIGIVVSTTPYTAGTGYLSVDPMTPAHCTAGRWATFTSPAFTSEADCLAFVT